MDEVLEFQLNDSRSIEKFIGLGVMKSILDATMLAFSVNGCARLASSRNCLSASRTTYEPKGWRPLVDRSLMPRSAEW